MAFEVKRRDLQAVLLFEVIGALDSRSSGDLETELLSGLKEGSPAIVLDFEKLEYISSAGLRVLHMIRQRLVAEGTGRTLAICSVNTAVQEVLDISGMSRGFTILGSRSETLTWLGQEVELSRVSAHAFRLLRIDELDGPRKAGARPSRSVDTSVISLAARLLGG